MGKAVSFLNTKDKDPCELTIDQKLVASSDPNDEETSFSGAARLKLGISPTGLFLPDPLDTNISTNFLQSATVPRVSSPFSVYYSLLEY